MGKGFSGAGDFTIHGNDIDIEGVTSFDGGEFNRVTVEGVVNVKNELQANEMEIEGVFNSSHVVVNHLSVEGVATIDGNLRCHIAEIDGVLNLKEGKLEADSLNCDGVLKVEGEVNADQIKAEGSINAQEIYGDEITICSVPNNARGIFRGIGKLLQSINLDGSDPFKGVQASHIGTLEATRVILEYVSVKNLCGTDITIGEGCCVDTVDCDGTLRISKYAKVKDIRGDHTYIMLD